MFWERKNAINIPMKKNLISILLLRIIHFRVNFIIYSSFAASNFKCIPIPVPYMVLRTFTRQKSETGRSQEKLVWILTQIIVKIINSNWMAIFCTVTPIFTPSLFVFAFVFELLVIQIDKIFLAQYQKN